jgi:glyoxylase-like metal-dependent hydrolase (beta-lactamase superfamily II)
MHTKIYCSSFLIFLLSWASQPSYAQNRVHRLAQDVYYWSGDLSTHEQTNVGFVVFRDYVLVIDANFPWAAEKIITDIKAITPKPVRFVFNTHYHADHTLGNSVFTAHGATIVSTDDLALELGAKGMEDVRDQTKINLKHLELPSIRFQDRLVFDDGQHRVELIKYGQAHTKGDGVAYLHAEGNVFVGYLAVIGPTETIFLTRMSATSVGFAHSTTLPSSPSRSWFRPTEILVMLICCIASGTLSPTCGNRSSRVSKPESLPPN